MLGAVIGDVVGSRFEFDNLKSKDFDLFHPDCRFTDDTVMTVAVAKAILDVKKTGCAMKTACRTNMLYFGRKYPDAGYGHMFKRWLRHDHPKPYNSLGNGSAMRVSPCGIAAHTEKEAQDLAYDSAVVSHNHEEGLAGAMAISEMIFMARQKCSKSDMRDRFIERYFPLGFTLDEIRESYEFMETCAGSVPQAMEAFLEADSFEDALRNAVSIGGDSDTIAAMTGAIAGEFFGIPSDMKEKTRTFLDADLLAVVDAFESAFPL